jgi:hypothetical protein
MKNIATLLDEVISGQFVQTLSSTPSLASAAVSSASGVSTSMPSEVSSVSSEIVAVPSALLSSPQAPLGDIRGVESKEEINISLLSLISDIHLFQVIIPSNSGTYKLDTVHGFFIHEISNTEEVNFKFENMSVKLKGLNTMPQIPTIPLKTLRIQIFNSHNDQELLFDLKNVLVCFRPDSPILAELRKRRKVYFDYQHAIERVPMSVYMERYESGTSEYILYRRLGFARSPSKFPLNKHGVNKKQLEQHKASFHTHNPPSRYTPTVDEKKSEACEMCHLHKGHSLVCMFYKPDVISSVSEVHRGSLDRMGVVFTDKPPGEQLVVRHANTRRKFPFKEFSMRAIMNRGEPDPIQYAETNMMFTVKDDKWFVCPISGYETFATSFGRSRMLKYRNFGKFIKALMKEKRPLAGVFEFLLFDGKNYPIDIAKVHVEYDYFPSKIKFLNRESKEGGDENRGTITITYNNKFGRVKNTYTTTLVHLAGTFNEKASWSPEKGIRHFREMKNRFHCPHEDACDRNCAHFISEMHSIDNSDEQVRINIPDNIHCTCVGLKGCSVVVSPIHHQIEIGEDPWIELSGVPGKIYSLFQYSPQLFVNAPIVILLENSDDVLMHISSFLYSKRRPPVAVSVPALLAPPRPGDGSPLQVVNGVLYIDGRPQHVVNGVLQDI